MNNLANEKARVGIMTIKGLSYTLLAVLLILNAILLIKIKSAFVGENQEALESLVAKLESYQLEHLAQNDFEKIFFASSDLNQKFYLAEKLAALYEKNGDEEKALYWYLKAESIPGQKNLGTVKDKIFQLLTSLNKKEFANNYLDKSTQLENSDKNRPEDQKVVARAFGQNISVSDFLLELESYPTAVRESLKTNQEQKKEVLKKIAVDRYLYHKLLKEKYENQISIKKELNLLKRKFLTEHYIRNKVFPQDDIKEENIKKFYDTNKEKFVVNENGVKKTIDFHLVRDGLKQNIIEQKLREIYAEVFREAIENKNIQLFEDQLP